MARIAADGTLGGEEKVAPPAVPSPARPPDTGRLKPAEFHGDERDAPPLQEGPPRIRGRSPEPSTETALSGEISRSHPRERAQAPLVALSPAGLQRVVGAVRMSASQGGVEVRLRLHPEPLGDVQVQVRLERGILTARLEAATPTARDALESGLPNLRAALHEQGVPVDHLEVGVRMYLEARSHGHTPGREEGPVLEPPSVPAVQAPNVPEAIQPLTGRLDIRI